MERVDYAVIGGGIVGLATAWALVERHPGASVVVIEKERQLASHQTGHNSGVIHSGIYYEPGSLKAKLCRLGERQTKEFCQEFGVAHDSIGKLLVATTPDDCTRLDALTDRAKAAGIQARSLDRAGLRELEPNVSGMQALLIPATAIVDYRRVARALGDRIRAADGRVLTGRMVTGLVESTDDVAIMLDDEETIVARQLVACAGLQADRVARIGGLDIDLRIVPFRGEYYRLTDNRANVVSHLVYPVPDPALPFLGVHITPMINGLITVGPNAVLGLAREGYGKTDVSIRDVVDWATYRGLWRLGTSHPRVAAKEVVRSLSRRLYARAVQEYCPMLEAADMLPHPAGIRAQALRPDGSMVEDFLFGATHRQLHVLNAPSPAATSALPIGSLIADRLSTLSLNRPGSF